MLSETWNAPRRVLRSRMVPLRTTAQSALPQACRKKSIKREATCSARLSVRDSGREREALTGRKKSPDMQAKQHELEQLKCAHVMERKEAERVKQRAAREKRMRQRQDSQRKRQMLKLEQAEKRMSLKKAREKMLRAKLLLRDAKKSQRAAEKERKKRELTELVARKKEERRRARQLSSTLTLAKGSRCT